MLMGVLWVPECRGEGWEGVVTLSCCSLQQRADSPSGSVHKLGTHDYLRSFVRSHSVACEKKDNLWIHGRLCKGSVPL